ncbi:transposase [Paenibacillus aestuarii]|uniref:Transposase n=1 Tax=Paenibacillus aestuarii TaxID=516965 RepID=A0ABW0KAK3_9BACL|nr:transposase [Paenibacillus aestuarii]
MDFDNMTLDQFQRQFNTEDACAELIYRFKWPTGYFCPRCNHKYAYLTQTRRLPLYECMSCRHQTSLTTGTMLEGSRTPLRKWLLAIFLLSRTDQGTNAVQLARVIQVTYKTAWLMLHKIRQSLHTADKQNKLTGTVQVNSAVYGRPYNPSVRKHPKEHFLIVGSSINEIGNANILKIQLVQSDNIQYRRITRLDILTFNQLHIDSQAANIACNVGLYSPKRKRPLMKYASLASKWLNQTFHGIGFKHLQIYLDEFCYRFNLTQLHQPIFRNLLNLIFSHTKIYTSHPLSMTS